MDIKLTSNPQEKSKDQSEVRKINILCCRNRFFLPSYSVNHLVTPDIYLVTPLGVSQVVNHCYIPLEKKQQGRSVGQCNKYFIAFYNAIVNN